MNFGKHKVGCNRVIPIDESDRFLFADVLSVYVRGVAFTRHSCAHYVRTVQVC